MAEIPSNILEQAEGIRRELADGVATIRDDAELSPAGKQRRLAVRWTEAEAKISNLQRSFEENSATEMRVSARDVFGATTVSGAEAISARDADDRAAQFENAAGAKELMDRAIQNGDSVLARAVALHAYNQWDAGADFWGEDWGGVVDTYSTFNPTIEAALERLLKQRATPLSANTMFAFSLSKPRELETVSALQLAALAESR